MRCTGWSQFPDSFPMVALTQSKKEKKLAVGWVSEKCDCNESIPHAELQ